MNNGYLVLTKSKIMLSDKGSINPSFLNLTLETLWSHYLFLLKNCKRTSPLTSLFIFLFSLIIYLFIYFIYFIDQASTKTCNISRTKLI